MNNDLISRSELRKEFKKCPVFTEVYLHYARQLIDNAPTVEITEEQAIDKLHETGWLPLHDKEMTERPTGHWIAEECSLGKTYYCSECYAHPEVCFDYCPYCGADMRGKEE